MDAPHLSGIPAVASAASSDDVHLVDAVGSRATLCGLSTLPYQRHRSYHNHGCRLCARIAVAAGQLFARDNDHCWVSLQRVAV